MVDTVTVTPEVLAEAISTALASQQSAGTYDYLAQSAQGAGDALNNTAAQASGFGAAFQKINNLVSRGVTAAGNRTGDIGTNMNVVGIPTNLQVPMTEAVRSADAAGAMGQAGVILDSLKNVSDMAASLNLTQDQMAQFAESRIDQLRATGLLGDEAMNQLLMLRESINRDTEFSVEQFKALGVSVNEIVGYSSTFASLYGPSMQGNVQGMNEALEENIRRQTMLAQTTGMSVSEQIRATEAIMETPGALARQMDLITNPKMTQALVGFSNTVAAIGASDLAEGFVSGVGLPTPGNEIEAALKPMSTALMAQINEATIRGDDEAVRRLSAELQVVYARESQGVMQELGRFAPYLGSEFGFLKKDLENQRATMLGMAGDPNFVSGQQAAAQQQIQVRLDDAVLNSLAALERSNADLSTQLLKNINLLQGEGGAVEIAARAGTGVTGLAAELSAAMNEVFGGALSDLNIQAADISVSEAIIDLEKAVLEGTATDEDVQMLDELKAINTEITKFNAGGQFDSTLFKRFQEIMPFLEENYTKPRQTAAVDEFQNSGTTLEQTSPGLVGQGVRIIGGMIKSLPLFNRETNNTAPTPTDDQQSSLVPLLEEQNKKLDSVNTQLTELTSVTGGAGFRTARAIEQSDTSARLSMRAGA
jgi:hypothetical protein